MYTKVLNIASSSTQSITLYDLQRMVRTTIEGRFMEPLWVSAEISELKVNRSGHCYLNLVEKGESDGAPRAEARAVIWRTTYATLDTAFHRTTGIHLAAGIRVLVRVGVTYHEVYGFSLHIVDIDPSYTLGEVERRRRETIARLKSDGVWDMNRELVMASPTLRIAIISSATAAGYQDFMRELRRCPYRFEVTLFESLMQGDAAEHSVVAALDAIAMREEEFDAVAIIRGGGSTSDLALFDSYIIASHVAQFPLPIISGIGHDKDISIVDMVAHTMCKTPTAVATHFVERVDELMQHLESLTADIRTHAERIIHEHTLHIYSLHTDVERVARERVNMLLNNIERLESGIKSHVEFLLLTESRRLDNVERTLQNYSLDNILRLGFAVVRCGEAVVAHSHEARVGERIEIELMDGVIGAEVRDVTPHR
ncbi:MAG: exodeoxyribonuclease VII large subunit [Alistipes sp.]|nr:exodeoxyribonuclease VII large subunit [Alistipes sp.]